MNQKEVAELRRRFKLDKSAISRIYGCYVNSGKEVVSYIDESLGMLPEEEAEKYLGLLKKALSGTQGKNLIDIVFSTDQVVDSDEHRLLMALRDSGLKDGEIRQTFYQKVIESLDMGDRNYLILLAHDTYDVPYRAKDGETQADASDQVFSYGILNAENLVDYLAWIDEPDPDAADKFLAEHEFENEQQIIDYLKEHTENGKLEYLVRGALLRCRHGSHARRLNLLKCHGIYITTHPAIHEANCVAGLGPEKDNITFFGVCKAPTPPASESVTYKKDSPRDERGCPCGDAPFGFESGHKCQPEIVGYWKDTYPKTRIVDNGLLDPGDRALAESDNPDTMPHGLSSVTTLSFLVCRYGGLIEPYNSGQEYINADEEAYAKEHSLEDTTEGQSLSEVTDSGVSGE